MRVTSVVAARGRGETFLPFVAVIRSQWRWASRCDCVRITQPTTLWSDPVVLRRTWAPVSNAPRHTHQGGVLLVLRQREDMLVFEVGTLVSPAPAGDSRSSFACPGIIRGTEYSPWPT
jgi:hypothetical protein